jgi:transposase-like protein
MGRRGYPPEFRRKVLDLVEAGRKVADVARDLGISDQTIGTRAAPGPHRPWPGAGSDQQREDRAGRGQAPDR